MRKDHIPRCRADRDRHTRARSRVPGRAKADEAPRRIRRGAAHNEWQAMPRLAANQRLCSLPDELRADVTEPGNIEWLVVVHGEFSSVAIHHLFIDLECRLLFNHPNRES